MSSSVVHEKRSPRSRNTSPPVLFGRALAFEWTKLSGVRATVVNACLALLGTVGLSILFGASLRFSAENGVLDDVVPATQLAYQSLSVTQALVIAIITLFVTSEYASGSISTTLQAVPRRGRVLLSKAVVGLALGVVFGVVLSVVGAVAGQLAAGDWATLDAGELIRMALGTSVYLALLNVIVVGVAFALRSTAGALVTLFVFIYVVPQVLPAFGIEWLTTAANYLPTGAFAVLSLGFSEPYGWPIATVVMIGWAAAAVIIGYVLLQRRDSR